MAVFRRASQTRRAARKLDVDAALSLRREHRDGDSLAGIEPGQRVREVRSGAECYRRARRRMKQGQALNGRV